MPRGWRIVKRKHAGRAFDGEGARRHGGRWNSPGTSLVYTAESRSLAILEILVHLESSAVLASYVLCAAGFAEAQVERLDRGRLPASWRAFPAPAELQRLGDEWVRGGTSLVLEVPSALVAQESNFLINPRHPDAATLEIEPPETFALDLRLLR
ncbi:MAG TPA: RES family NAD+ phosphorylase [Thermoanaerobaculia bacterium]|nr:RES family NAD+ phosphorylase [Thermoanaerobaculia bacterium]